MECITFASINTTNMIQHLHKKTKGIFSFIAILSVLGILIISSCRKDEDFLFTMDYDLEVNIQPGLNTIEIHGTVLSDIQTQIEAYLATNGITKNQITKISSGSARMSEQLSGSGYGFIDRVEIYVVNPDDPVDRRLVFERLAVPQNTGQQLELLGSLIDSKAYLTEETFDLNFEIRLRQTSPGLVKTRLQLEFRVQVEQ